MLSAKGGKKHKKQMDLMLILMASAFFSSLCFSCSRCLTDVLKMHLVKRKQVLLFFCSSAESANYSFPMFVTFSSTV